MTDPFLDRSWHPRPVRHIVLPLCLAFVLGCAGASTAGASSGGGPPTIAPPAAEDQTCSRDSECVLVQDCCGCDRQGTQLAVHRDRVEALTAAGTTDCASVSC